MSNPFSEDNEEERRFQPPAHHPFAPSHESFDISTTVDPSYVISMIRRLLPSDVKDDEQAVESGLIHEDLKEEGGEEDFINLPENGGEGEAVDFSENMSKSEGTKPGNDYKNCGRSKAEDTWEECGCVLWDLAASEDHAQFMVQNLILEVILANLTVSQVSRITEISLGIIGNLACHEIPRKQIVSTNGLVRVIVEQLLLDDVPCLCEACRVLSLCLQGNEGVIWAKELQTEQMLSRILWIAENALNPQLIEKVVGLLLAILESQQEVAHMLLPPIMKLDLSNLLVKLLAFEMTKLAEERIPARYPVLDLIVRAIEVISTMDEYSQEICLNKELLLLVKDLIELPDKFEVSSSCVTAAVLIANILTDATDLASQLPKDVGFLQALFDVLPFASDEVEAQNAIWSTIARLLILVRESEMSPSNLHTLVAMLASKLELIEDAHLACPLDHQGYSVADKIDWRLIALKRVFEVLTKWKSSDDKVKCTSSAGDQYINTEDVDKLLDLCREATTW